MTTAKDIRREIRELKREMKACGIPVMSVMNGGHTSDSYRYNSILFRLKTELLRATS